MMLSDLVNSSYIDGDSVARLFAMRKFNSTYCFSFEIIPEVILELKRLEKLPRNAADAPKPLTRSHCAGNDLHGKVWYGCLTNDSVKRTTTSLQRCAPLILARLALRRWTSIHYGLKSSFTVQWYDDLNGMRQTARQNRIVTHWHAVTQERWSSVPRPTAAGFLLLSRLLLNNEFSSHVQCST